MIDTLDTRIAERLDLTVLATSDNGAVYTQNRQGFRVWELWSNSYDTIHRDLLPRLTEEQWKSFAINLCAQCQLWPYISSELIRLPLLATPEQLCIAWLEATKETK